MPEMNVSQIIFDRMNSDKLGMADFRARMDEFAYFLVPEYENESKADHMKRQDKQIHTAIDNVIGRVGFSLLSALGDGDIFFRVSQEILDMQSKAGPPHESELLSRRYSSKREL